MRWNRKRVACWAWSVLWIAMGLVSALGEEANQMEEIFSIIEEHKSTPQTFEDYDKLATIAYARGNYEEALLLLDKCLELAAEDAALLGVIWTEKGSIFEKLDKQDEALEAYNTADGFTPYYPQMLMRRGKLYLEKSDYALATEDLQEYISLLPEDSAGYEQLAKIQREKGDKHQADENEKLAKELAERIENTTLTAARLSALQGDLQGAEQGYTQYLDAATDEKGKVHFLRGTVRMQLGMLEEAVLDLTTAIVQEYEDVGVCYEYLSSCYFTLGNYQEVVEAGEKCIASGSQQPIYSSLYQRMGIASIALGDMENAVVLFSQSIDKDNALDGNYYYRGLANMGNENYTDALTDLTESIARGEVMQRSLYNRGLCYIQMNEINLGVADLREALNRNDEEEISSAAEEILWQLALQYIAAENPEE